MQVQAGHRRAPGASYATGRLSSHPKIPRSTQLPQVSASKRPGPNPHVALRCARAGGRARGRARSGRRAGGRRQARARARRHPALPAAGAPARSAARGRPPAGPRSCPAQRGVHHQRCAGCSPASAVYQAPRRCARAGGRLLRQPACARTPYRTHVKQAAPAPCAREASRPTNKHARRSGFDARS